MNFEVGAMGLFSEANATIGRAWTLISKNLGCWHLGETYTRAGEIMAWRNA